MKHSIVVLALFGILRAYPQSAPQELIPEAANRISLSLNGKWNYIIDPYENGYYDYRYKPYDEDPNPGSGYFLDKHPRDKSDLVEYDFDRSPTLTVPGDWNSQDQKLLYYEGSIWYRKTFPYTKAAVNNRVFVRFGAANYETDVYLNGKKLGKHIGGFTPFGYEITRLLDKQNSIVVKVDNKRKREGVPTLNTDWWNYGGITRDVDIVEVPETYICDYSVQLKKGSTSEISGYVRLDGPRRNQKISIRIPELQKTVELTTDEQGSAALDFPLEHVELWSPRSPRLYDVLISSETDSLTERIGFRCIETKGTEILLNRRRVFLRGVCIHGENPLRGGRAYALSDAQMLLGWAKELGCNFVRLAHYPHSENMVRLADAMGIMVWEEDPVYWTILWDNPATFDNAGQQLTDLIRRDKNRASVIVWSMANETPVSEARTSFLQRLAVRARSLDGTRLISAALEVHRGANPDQRIVEDPFAESVDLLSFNEYVGWYDGLPESCDRIDWRIQYEKPVVISEFGGDALQGFHGDALTRFSEEYQKDLYVHTLPMLSRIPQLSGMSPWILCDFRSPRRALPNIQDGWNRKGLIGQNGTKKEAFFVLKHFYDAMKARYPD